MDLSKGFGPRINRQLINPAELNSKDAQFSYSISLPMSERNSVALGRLNVEETKNKFNKLFSAEYIVDGVRIFKGAFKMSAANAREIKGNLYVPDTKSIKDIFGDLLLTGNAPLTIPFEDFVTSINEYNNAAAVAPQAAIFPYVMYGLLPKVPLNRNSNNYSPRTVWDESVRIGMQDLPPSINPLIMLKHIFSSQGYQLQGNAFDDKRLAQVYQSYRNAPDYVQPWNYGQHAKIQIDGEWSSRYNMRTGGERLERGINQGSGSGGNTFAVDMLDSTNAKLNVTEDSGGNVLVKELDDSDGVTWVNGQIRIPVAGFYKVRFGASIHVYDWEDWRTTDPATGVQHIGGRTSNVNNWFQDNPFEVRLSRDLKGGADFGLGSPKLNGVFYYDNQPQNNVFDDQSVPKYFPQVLPSGQLNLIDAAQDRKHLLGFMFGKHEADKNGQDIVNPLDTANRFGQILVAKPAQSWDSAAASEDITRLAVKSLGWQKYGRIGNFDNEGDNPDLNVDFSGGDMVTGKVLDSNGNPQDPSTGGLGNRVAGYALSALTGFATPLAGWKVSDFIDMNLFQSLAFSATYDGEAGDLAALTYYDANLQFIGFGFLVPAAGAPSVTYTNEPINRPTGAAYVRMAEQDANPLTITGENTADQNIILQRFILQRYYTYKFKLPYPHVGRVYLFNGTDTTPVTSADFDGTQVELSTTFLPIADFTPRVTLYLKTASFDIQSDLIIERTIEPQSSDVIGWEATNKYSINLDNAPDNFAVRGLYNGGDADANWYAQGDSAAVVWLNAGELLTVSSVSSEGRYRRSGMHSTYGLVSHEIKFNLSVQPFRTDASWLKVSQSGNGTARMDWNDAPNFVTDSINLVGFLANDVKTDEYIDNFVKAFNLKLSQLDATTFSLDTKQTKQSISSLFVDLDTVASVVDRENSPLGLPSLYKIGFTINTDEQGYVETKDDGGGTYQTGATDGGVVEQKSTFSYNWYKSITQGAVQLPFPLISRSEVWSPLMPYAEAMLKRYTDLPYRFWYYDGLLNDLGATFQFNAEDMELAKVSEHLGDASWLNYKNQKFTLLDNYFTILINGASHYTEIEAKITPAQYTALNGAILAKFNGDLYYIAELVGYDATGKNSTKIKLIRRI